MSYRLNAFAFTIWATLFGIVLYKSYQSFAGLNDLPLFNPKPIEFIVGDHK